MNQHELESRIESCQGLVRTIALAIHKKMHGTHELDDLIAYGQLGLAQAASEFDPSRGAQLSTYAYYRIRGAIYDGGAKMGWQRQTDRRDAAWNDILAEDAENPVEEKGSDRGEWLNGITARMATATLLNSAGDVYSKDVADEAATQPVVEICREELRTHLRLLVDQLPAEYAELIREMYFLGNTMQDAGAKLGMSKSWASRMHAKALQLLGDQLRRMGFED